MLPPPARGDTAEIVVSYLHEISKHVNLRSTSTSRESGKVRPPPIERLAAHAAALHLMGEDRQECLPILYDTLDEIAALR